MIETVIFVVTNLAIFFVIHWLIENDKRPKLTDQTGYLRMRLGLEDRQVRKRPVPGPKPKRRVGK